MIKVASKKFIWYMGFHNGNGNEMPEIQEEHRQEIELDMKTAGKLLRAMRQILNEMLEA